MTQPIVLMGEVAGRTAACCGKPAKLGHVVTVYGDALRHVWCDPEAEYPDLGGKCWYIGCPLPIDENRLCTSHHTLYCAPRHPNDEGLGKCPFSIKEAVPA